MNPFDWENLKLTKDKRPIPRRRSIHRRLWRRRILNVAMMWGKPVVTTTAMTRGTAIVGAFRLGAQLWRRRGINVQTTNSDARTSLTVGKPFGLTCETSWPAIARPAFCT
jgi:hypothetical protein